MRFVLTFYAVDRFEHKGKTYETRNFRFPDGKIVLGVRQTRADVEREISEWMETSAVGKVIRNNDFDWEHTDLKQSSISIDLRDEEQFYLLLLAANKKEVSLQQQELVKPRMTYEERTVKEHDRYAVVSNDNNQVMIVKKPARRRPNLGRARPR